MKLLDSTSRKLGLLISLIASVLINFYQFVIILFDIKPHPIPLVPDMGNIASQGTDFVINMVFCFVTSWIVFEINNYFINRNEGWWNLLFRILLSMIVAFISIYLFSHTYISHSQIEGDIAWGIKMHFRGRGIMISFLMIVLVQMLHLYRKNQKQRSEMERLSVENMRSKYMALKSQIDPHFLFNSLNTLGGLITIDGDRAQHYLQRLSSIFRYSMQDKEIVTLAEELEFAKTYGELLRIRYGESLRLTYDIPHVVIERNIMPFSLQLLIENAVKHNVVTNSMPLEISIFYRENENRIYVENKINRKREKEMGEGIGLANLAKRYEFFGKREIEIKNREGVFSVSVPLI